MRAYRVGGVFVLITAMSSLAHAQARQAAALFQQGRKLMAAGEVIKACALLEQSQALEPKVTTLLNVAGCREKAGQLATAHRLFLEAAQQTEQDKDEVTTQLHRVAMEHALRLEPLVSRLVLRVPEAVAKLDGVELLRDGQVLQVEAWSRELLLDGGTYTLSARAPKMAPWSTQIAVAAEGDRKVVEVPALESLEPSQPVEQAKPAPPAAPPPVVEARPQAAPLTRAAPPRPMAIAVEKRSMVAPLAFGAGALALGGGAVGTWLWASSTYERAKEERTSQADRDELERSANQRRYVSEGLAVAGVACAGVALWLVLRSPREQTATPPVASVLLVPQGAGLEVVARF